ncbi:MAG: LapA family protein [Pseudomonadota bacterium]
MRYLVWLLRLVVFLLLLGFAVKNGQPATLRFYFGYEWNTSLVVLLLFFFIAGTLTGILAMLGTVYRQRRESIALKRESRLQDQTEQTEEILPSPDQPS